MYLCGGGIDFVSFYNFSIGCWNCSDSVVFLFYKLLFFKSRRQIAIHDKETNQLYWIIQKTFFINSKQKRYAVFILSCTFHILEKCRYFFIVTCIRLSIDALIKNNYFLTSLISNNNNNQTYSNYIIQYLIIYIFQYYVYNVHCPSLLKLERLS